MITGAGQATAELVDYQKEYDEGLPMHPHGHPDPATLVNLDVYDPTPVWSDSQLAYIRGGSRPSTFLRDLQGVSNQTPQWVWLTAGGLFLLFGYFAYRSEKKKK